MSETLILEKLSKLENQYAKTESKLDKIENQYANTESKLDKIDSTISVIAVQTERLNAMSVQVQVLWNKYDDAFKPDGVVSKIQRHQAGCPKDTVKESLDRMWVVIGLMATAVTGCLLKAFGGF